MSGSVYYYSMWNILYQAIGQLYWPFFSYPPSSLLLQSRREMYSTSWYSLPIPTCKFISRFQNTSSALGVCLILLPFCEPFRSTLNATYVEVFGKDPGLNERSLCGQYDLTSSSLCFCGICCLAPISVQCTNEDKSWVLRVPSQSSELALECLWPWASYCAFSSRMWRLNELMGLERWLSC